MTTYLLAGGGTAGHVNPLLALADKIREHEPDAVILALGTPEGLENRLVPERGYELLTVPKLPLPRKPSAYALKFPFALNGAIKSVQKILRDRKVDVVVGFGGYASAPAYLAAKRSGVALVVHEANALPGFANKLGAGFADAVAVAFSNTKLVAKRTGGNVVTGMPLRPEIEAILDQPTNPDAAKHFGLDPELPVLLVTGGSLGARSINNAVESAKTILRAAGIQVLHIVGDKSELPLIDEPGFKRIAYCDRMDLAIQAADFAISRAGASTVSEFAAFGLPAVYVPYPVGNGEQVFNVSTLVEARGGLFVKDADLNADWIANTLVPIVSKRAALQALSNGALSQGIKDGAERLYRLVRGVLAARA
jgi:UDP-N-acetylglucosamine--N-acetylmuramyl-(pentapeptide) pyrophosphoryl-undecaprenol N-acetylglucosamine transferase